MIFVLLKGKVKRALCNRKEILSQRQNCSQVIIRNECGLINRCLPSELEVLLKPGALVLFDTELADRF